MQSKFPWVYQLHDCNFEKSGNKLKQRFNKVCTKPNLYSSGIKLMKLVYTTLNVSFRVSLVTNVSFSQNIFTSREESDWFNLSSDFLKFHHEVDKIKKILSKNAYPQKYIDKCIQKFLNNMFIQRPQILTLPKKELIILPYLGNMHQIVKTRLTKTMNKHRGFCKLRVNGWVWLSWYSFPAGIYMFKVNSRNIRTRRKICSKLTIKTPERRHWQKKKLTLIYKILMQKVHSCSHLTEIKLIDSPSFFSIQI